MFATIATALLPAAVRVLNWFLDSKAENDAGVRAARDKFREAFALLAGSPSAPANLAREYKRQNKPPVAP